MFTVIASNFVREQLDSIYNSIYCTAKNFIYIRLPILLAPLATNHFNSTLLHPRGEIAFIGDHYMNDPTNKLSFGANQKTNIMQNCFSKKNN